MYPRLLLLLLVGMLMSANAYSQRKKVKIQKYDKLFVGFDYGVYSGNLVVEPDANWEIFQKDDNSWNQGRGNFYQFIIGASVNKNLSFSSGITFNNLEITQTEGFGFWRCDPLVFGATDILGAKRHVKLSTLEIPLEAKYRFKLKHFELYPAIGFRTILYTDKYQNIDILLDNEVIGEHQWNDKELDHNQDVNFAIELKTGLSYHLFERFNIKLEPFYRINLKHDAILEEYSKTRFYNFGVLMGIEYALIYEKA